MERRDFDMEFMPMSRGPYLSCPSRMYGKNERSQPFSTWNCQVDSQGALIVGGHTYSDVGQTNAGSRDAFVAKFDGGQTLLWQKLFGGDGDDYAEALEALRRLWVPSPVGADVWPRGRSKDFWKVELKALEGSLRTQDTRTKAE